VTPRLVGVSARLPTSAGDRRAVQALLNDWRYDAANANGAFAAALVSARWSWALCITLGRIALKEIVLPSAWLPVAVAIVVAAAAGVVLQFGMRSASTPWDHATVLWLVPTGMAFFLAPMLAVTLSWSRRAAPLGAALLVTAVMVGLTGWLAPAATQAFREAVYMQLATAPVPGEPRQGPVELSVSQLLARSGKGVHVEAVRAQLSLRSALVAWAVAGLALGVQVQRRRQAQSSRWHSIRVPLATAVSALLGVVCVTAVVGLSGIRLPVNLTWTYVVWFVALSAWLGRRRREHAMSPATSS
jgi:hypothetical protein